MTDAFVERLDRNLYNILLTLQSRYFEFSIEAKKEDSLPDKYSNT